MDSFFLQATIYLGAAVIAVPVAARLGLGSVLGYLLAGVIIGPVLGVIGSEAASLQHFAEFGVVMMLFLIGLELEPRALWEMRHRLIGLGGLQIVVTAALVAWCAAALGQPWPTAVAIGMILSLSSTAIVLQTLSERRLIQTPGGRSAFSVLLTQDIAVIPMLLILPLLAVLPSIHNEPASPDHLSLVEGLPGWGVTLVTLAAIAIIVLGGTYLVRPLFRFIHSAGLREMYTAFALLLVIGIAALMSLVGISPALGTFLAGVVLGTSEFRHELESDIEPFKGLLLGLFFITVGAGIQFGLFLEQPFTILGVTLGLMALKGVVLFALARLFRLSGRNLWLFTLGLAQAGEFGFVLVSFSAQQNVMPVATAESLLLVIAFSMLLTPLFFLAFQFLSARYSLAETGGEEEADTIDEQHPIIIAGVGRFGQVVVRLIQSSGLSATVLDRNLKTVDLMRAFGFKSYFGDPTRPDLLHAAGLDKARILVVAVDDEKSATRLVSYARSVRPDLHIIARARDRSHVFDLYRAGADKIVRELFDASLRAGRYALEAAGLSEYEAHQAEALFYQMDRTALQELAPLWDPKIPPEKNEAYMRRARELNKDLEAALLAQFKKGKAA